ncbi:serine/threonine-protein kinase [Planctomycetes bacterium K23_9]|uniref:Serine/threonine-protein kinase PrkC n=1 Tax=Stieleria marina TaxID=1930275 RepID=A0A517NN34_9BACT|nr:Serine/threonine-protein kinase PrkC [Planctomycetes bacterium K23_9]
MTGETGSGESNPERRGNELPTTAFDSDDLRADDNLDATIAADMSVGCESDSLGDASNRSSKLPQLDGYELLEELGRGGMGVVYRARHEKLDRIVAIKMILAGQFASADSIARFELEAETAARLDHPGIVPIYETGQSGDHHFFSMKLIDGSPLSALLDQFQPDQRKSAELMIKIAQAVQHAHQRGVLHRDLKPANVLIDPDGQPLLTDLGLAKQLDNDSAITQTGLVLGSPGFMSPEQAAGKADVTVAADVYAMGAILYWMVAGRAPITGENAFDVVRRTIEHEPESMREIRSDADRDLNLICLKALQKAPDQRYASADDFATDLQAWLDGEPLSVKPPTLFTSTRRWVQKNFRGVAVGVGTGTICGLWMGLTILLQIAEQQFDTASSLHEQLEAADPPWITEAFAWVKKVPAGLGDSLVPWITVVTAICGIATIGLSKPKRGESGAAPALTATLLSGILAFVISWAWAPIANRAEQASEQDLQLLSDYVFLHPDDRHLAEEVLFQRYPGLPKANSWQRSELMQSKIVSDQISSIPAALWTGLIVTAFIAALPIFASSLFAGLVWHREHRGWKFFWRSLEVAFYASTLMFLMSRSFGDFTGAAPAWHFQLISAVVISAAIGVALKRKSLWLRIPLFLAVFVTSAINVSDTGKVTRSRWIAQNAKTDAELAKALPYLERHLDHSRDRESRFRLATVYARLGEEKKYKKQCKTLLENGNFYRRAVAEQAAKVVLLKPDLHDDLSQAHLLAQWTSQQRAYNSWDYLCRTLSEYRQGNFDDTISWAEKSRKTAISQNAWQRETVIATAHLLESLAYQSQGNDQQSKQSLQLANENFDRESEVSFEAKLTYQILKDELAK